jgi:ADP-heptose:LPS heptosyltransferase
VGIVWAGKPAHTEDNSRSCPLRYFIPLSKIPGVRLYGLQKGEAARKVKDLTGKISVTNLADELNDFTDTAGVIENLDLVISVDTAVLHLAGAMGKPAWAILPFTPDWRWMLSREDSPWYPTVRLFRQKRHGDWDNVFRRLAKELRILAGK